MSEKDFDEILAAAEKAQKSSQNSGDRFEQRARRFVRSIEETLAKDVAKIYRLLESAGAEVFQLADKTIYLPMNDARKETRGMNFHSLGIYLTSWTDGEGSPQGCIWVRPDGRLSDSREFRTLRMFKGGWVGAAKEIPFLHSGRRVVSGVRDRQGDITFRFERPGGGVFFVPDSTGSTALSCWCNLDAQRAEFWFMAHDHRFEGDARELLAHLAVKARDRILSS